MVLKTAFANCCNGPHVDFRRVSGKLPVGLGLEWEMTVESVGRGLNRLIYGSLCIGGRQPEGRRSGKLQQAERQSLETCFKNFLGGEGIA